MHIMYKCSSDTAILPFSCVPCIFKNSILLSSRKYFWILAQPFTCEPVSLYLSRMSNQRLHFTKLPSTVVTLENLMQYVMC